MRAVCVAVGLGARSDALGVAWQSPRERAQRANALTVGEGKPTRPYFADTVEMGALPSPSDFKKMFMVLDKRGGDVLQ